MQVIIIGDSHGNIANLKHVLGFAKKIKAGAIIHTGDWNNLKSLETVLENRILLYTVLGNADVDKNLESRLQKLEKTNFSEEFLKFKIDEVNIGLIHSISNLKLIENWKLKIENLDIVFTGHYHSQKIWEQNGVKIIRPGALEKTINFAVYDTRTNKVEFIHE